MNNFFIALIIGITAGIIDVVPMIIQKLNKVACVSAFIHNMALGLIITFVNWNLPAWITGMLVSILMAIPVMIIVLPDDKKALIPMTFFSLALGAGMGWAGTMFIS